MKLALLALLFAATSYAGFASSATLAKQGDITVSTEDFYAYHFMNSPKKVDALRESPKELQSTIVEVFTPRAYRNHPELQAKKDAQEQRYYALQLERAPLLADLNLIERRTRAAFNAADPIVIERAKEIWISDTAKFIDEESADITQIFFDFGLRTYAETIARIAEAQKQLADGAPFEDVLLRYTDDKAAKETNGKLQNISSARSDPLMGAIIFKKLNEGQVSPPTPSRIGLHIVRLDKKHPKKKRSFDEVKGKIFEQLMEDAVRRARVAFIESFNRDDISVDEKAFDDFLIKTDPALEEKRRDVYKQLGIPISEPIEVKK